MKKEDAKFFNIIIRYLLLILVAIPGMDLFYYIFLPLTKFPVYWAILPFYDVVLINNAIFFGFKTIEIIGACIAGSAYYFLMILNFSTPNIKWPRRLLILASTWIAFFIINVVRIYILSLMYLNGSTFFDIAHKMFWYLGSTLFLVVIWFLAVRIFRIGDIPIYEDLKFMYRSSSFKKREKQKRIRRIKNQSKN